MPHSKPTLPGHSSEDLPPVSSRRERRKQEFRRKIIEAAMTLFEKQGCDASTLEEICETADISRPTFYSYYASKQELIQALGQELWLGVAQELSAASLARHESTQQYIASFFELIKREFTKYGRLERELIRHSMISDPGEAGSIDIMRGLTQLFEAMYAEGLKRGEIGSHYPLDFLAEMTMGGINTVMMNWAVDENYPIDKRLEQLADYIPRMLEPPVAP